MTKHVIRLSPRQLQIARMIARGMTSKAIASALTIKETTVSHHVTLLLARTGSASRAEAVFKVFSR